ncbi:MAG: C10 family peptidase [Bacteroidales bacterium]|jgi:hypothetical protein|nr:C10 family peptidase [Bacteroidales bacterium]
MKKFLLITLILFLGTTAFSQAIDINSAKYYAQQWLNIANNESAEDLICVYTHSNGEKSQDYFYIFNSNANKTFIIVSADERVLPILGYSDEGCFDTNNFPPNMKAWLDGYAAEMDYIFSLDNIEKHPEWQSISEGNINKGTDAVEPLINLHWDQSPHYNALCPGNSVTGCVATAMAMIMKYWNHPVKGYGQSSYYHSTYGILSANYDTTFYQWDQMPIQVTSPNIAVATLMYHCGVSVRMQYDPSASGAYTTDVVYALKTYFGYQSQCTHKNKEDYSITDWENMMRAELDLGRPMQYHGSDVSYGGHSFNLDGYNDNNQFHFNWGWSGSGNGYFTISNLNVGWYQFNSNQGVVMNIEPNWDIICNEAQNLVGNINGSTVTLTWDAPEESDLTLEEYEIYKDGIKIGTTTETSFTEENISFGEYEYCINAVYDNGCVSPYKVCTTINSTACLPPADLQAIADNSTVNLSWTAPANSPNLDVYKIYRLDEFIGETIETEYTDEDLDNGNYEYCVIAIYNEIYESDEICDDVTVFTVGIINNNNEIKIYPNPASDYINIEAENITEISIIDISGKTVKNIQTKSNQITITTSELLDGIYFLKITFEDNKSVYNKFIINN